MMGMGQQMPMRRPQMGPSPMTAGRPNPMAQGGGANLPGYTPGGPMRGFQGPQPGYGVGPGGGGGMMPMGGPPGGGPMAGGGAFQSQGMGPNFAVPNLGGPAGAMRGFAPPDPGYGVGPGGGGGMMDVGDPWMGGGAGMSDAQMHPFAPRNQGGNFQNPGAQLAMPLGAVQDPMRKRFQQFPGALQRGIMQGMAPPPQAPPPNMYAQNFARGWGG